DRPDPRKPRLDIPLGTFAHSGALAAGSGNDSYTQQVQVTLPADLPSGQYYITPWADAYGNVKQQLRDPNINPDAPHDINSDNFKARPINVLGVGEPDLAVTSVTAPPHTDAGNPITVTWTVKNLGFGVTTSPVQDSVILSSAPVLGTPGAREIPLGEVTHTDPLNPGDSYTVTKTFDTQTDAAGRYVIVRSYPLPSDFTPADNALA